MNDDLADEMKLQIAELSRKIIFLIEDENPTTLVIIASLSSLLQSFCQTIDLPETMFRDLMQSVLNDYRK